MDEENILCVPGDKPPEPFLTVFVLCSRDQGESGDSAALHGGAIQPRFLQPRRHNISEHLILITYR